MALQRRLAAAAQEAVAAAPWTPADQGSAGSAAMVVGGCFVSYARGAPGPGRPGDLAFAAAVTWLAPPSGELAPRRGDRHLRDRPGRGQPRRADDIRAQAVVAAPVPAGYQAGLLALREGPILAAAVAALAERPEILVVDATGTDHPRRAGLAVHLGAVTGLATVGVTLRPLEGDGEPPEDRRGARSPVHLGSEVVGYWVITRTGARPLVAHAGWRTTPEVAASVLLRTTTPAARSPVPLQEARRVAREARSLAARARTRGPVGLSPDAVVHLAGGDVGAQQVPG